MSILSDRVVQAAHFVPITKEIPDASAKQVDFIWQCLSGLGIYDDDVSLSLLERDCKEGDARAVFCEGLTKIPPQGGLGSPINLPVPRFRRIWSILTGDAERLHTLLEKHDVGDTDQVNVNQALVEAIKGSRPIGQYTDEELLAKYNLQCSSEIEEELKKRSKGRNCMAFDKTEVDTYVLNQEVSLSALKMARRRDVPQSYRSVSCKAEPQGKVYRVYPVGEFPEQVYLICPLDGQALFNGYCDTCGVNWMAQHDVMVFIHLMVKAGIKLDVISIAGVQTKNLEALKEMYPKVAEVYEDLESIGELPSLKTKGTLKRSGKQDPFAPARY